MGAFIVTRVKYKDRREFEREMFAARLRKQTKLIKAKKLSRGYEGEKRGDAVADTGSVGDSAFRHP